MLLPLRPPSAWHEPCPPSQPGTTPRPDSLGLIRHGAGSGRESMICFDLPRPGTKERRAPARGRSPGGCSPCGRARSLAGVVTSRPVTVTLTGRGVGGGGAEGEVSCGVPDTQRACEGNVADPPTETALSFALVSRIMAPGLERGRDPRTPPGSFRFPTRLETFALDSARTSRSKDGPRAHQGALLRLPTETEGAVAGDEDWQGVPRDDDKSSDSSRQDAVVLVETHRTPIRARASVLLKPPSQVRGRDPSSSEDGCTPKTLMQAARDRSL